MSTAVTALLGTKLGMTQVWDENNRVVPVTVFQVGPCVVTQVRSPEIDGYSAVQLGYGAIKSGKVTKPQAGHFAKACGNRYSSEDCEFGFQFGRRGRRP